MTAVYAFPLPSPLTPSSKDRARSDVSVLIPYQLLIFGISLLETNPVSETGESHLREVKDKLRTNFIEVQEEG